MSVIIELNRKPTRKLVEAVKRKASSSSDKFQVHRRMSALNVISGRLPIRCLHRLCRHRHVKRIYPNGKVRVHLNVATPAVGAAKLQRRGIGGKGITIAIIDTGVFPHKDLTRPVNRIIAFKDLLRNRKKPYDDNGHGTHLAGDAAGNGFVSCGKYRGPANRANLVVVKAFDRNGLADSADVIAAIDWVLRHRKTYNIRILNMSFGSPGFLRCADDPVCRAAERAWKAGLVVVTAAGNNGPGRSTIESPGISPLLLTVGAVDDRRTIRQQDDRVAEFSGRGPAGGRVKPDITAPGVDIVSLRAPGSAIDLGDPEGRVGKCYFRMSGTSMATPIVAGAAAQLLQLRPSLKPQRVKKLLMRHAFRLRAGVDAQGSGELNLRFAARKLAPRCGVRRRRSRVYYAARCRLIHRRYRAWSCRRSNCASCRG
jgi:serine protease AprX